MEAVGQLVDVGAHAAEAVGERRDAVALLDPQLLRAGDAQLAAVRGQRAEHRQLVDDAGHFVRRDLGRAQLAVADDDRARSARRRRRVAASTSMSAPIRRRTSMMPVRVGFRPTSLDDDFRAGQRRGGHHPERRRRDIARHLERRGRSAAGRP